MWVAVKNMKERSYRCGRRLNSVAPLIHTSLSKRQGEDDLSRTEPSYGQVKDRHASEPGDHQELDSASDEPEQALELDLERGF